MCCFTASSAVDLYLKANLQTSNRNLYRQSLYKRSDEPAGPSSDMMVEFGQSLASTSTGKCPYFCSEHAIFSIVTMFTLNSSKTNFPEMH